MFTVDIKQQRNAIYLFPKHNHVKSFDVYFGMFSNVTISSITSLVLKISDTDSENVSLIRRSVSAGQKTCGSKDIY